MHAWTGKDEEKEKGIQKGRKRENVATCLSEGRGSGRIWTTQLSHGMFLAPTRAAM